MPNLFARQTSLSDVAGRLDYISNPLRQENLLATYDTASDLLNGQYWQILARESLASFEQYGAKTRTVKTKTGKKVKQKLTCAQAREVIFLVGNELLERMTPDEILKTACDAVSKKVGRPVTGALHLNKSTSSLHVHVIYAERELLQEPQVKIAERNLFFDAQGKRRYKKSEILDENKQLLPGCRIVKKGEIYESRCFSSVDEKMQSKEWLKNLKTDCILELRNGDLKGDVEITEYDPSTGMLPQQYIGNRARSEVAAKIAEYNELVKEFNAAVLDGVISHESAMQVQQDVLRARDRNEEITWYVNQIREILEEERRDQGLIEEEKKTSLSAVVSGAEGRRIAGSSVGNYEAAYWQQYKQIRDNTWEIFIDGQRREFQAINKCRERRKYLDFQNTHAVFDRKGQMKRERNSAAQLRKDGYFEKRDEIKADQAKHTAQLEFMRKYQEVAKGRQKIVRALLLAGAEKDVIDAAMKDYREAMLQLRSYTHSPEIDSESRRLKASQLALAQAKNKADEYIKKLEEKRLQEESQLEIQAEKEYQEFKEHGTVASAPVSGERSGPAYELEPER